MSSNRIIITAQRRALRRKIWEEISPKRLMETFFKDSFGKQMSLIREKDNEIRVEAENLKKYLQSAKKSLKDRRYLEFIQWITEIDKVANTIGSAGRDLEDLRKEQADEFYGQADPNIVDLDSMNKYFSEPVNAAQLDALIKEAGIMDWFGSQRERAAKMLEKMYSNTLRQRHSKMVELYNKAAGFVKFILNKLKDLDKARTARNISDYIAGLKEIREGHRSFNKDFRDIYNKNVKGIVDRLMQDRATKSGPGANLSEQDKPGVDDRTGKTMEEISAEERQKKKQEALEQQKLREQEKRQRQEQIQQQVTVPVSQSPQEQEFIQEQPQFGGVELVPSQLMQQYQQLQQQQIPSSTPYNPTELSFNVSAPRPAALPAELGLMRGTPEVDWWENLRSEQIARELERGRAPQEQAINAPSAPPTPQPVLRSVQPQTQISPEAVEQEKDLIVSDHPEMAEEAAIIVDEMGKQTTSPAEAAKKLQDLKEKAEQVAGVAKEPAKRPISEIAADIKQDWIKPSAKAVPLLEKMLEMKGDINEGIVRKFLAASSPYRTEKATELKNELRALIGMSPMRKSRKSEVVPPPEVPEEAAPEASVKPAVPAVPPESVSEFEPEQEYMPTEEEQRDFFNELMQGSTPPPKVEKKEKAKPRVTAPKNVPKKRGPKKPPARSAKEIREERRRQKARHTKAHAYFFNQLKKYADSPVTMANMLCKYSELIDDIDPNASAKLLNIAEGLLNNVG